MFLLILALGVGLALLATRVVAPLVLFVATLETLLGLKFWRWGRNLSHRASWTWRGALAFLAGGYLTLQGPLLILDALAEVVIALMTGSRRPWLLQRPSF